VSSILVVDDEAVMREFYRRALTAGGYLPLDVRTAEEALDFLAMTPEIQLVIADLNMPGHGGAWLVEQMRQRFPNVAVILATADESVPGTLSLQASVVNYLVKPISAEGLLTAVRDALANLKEPAASGSTEPAGDPFDAWLSRKLTHRPHGDDSDNSD
jgi:DNA-binding NtrC family response regulator